MLGKDIFDHNPEVNSLESLVCFEMKHREVNTDYRKKWATTVLLFVCVLFMPFMPERNVEADDQNPQEGRGTPGQSWEGEIIPVRQVRPGMKGYGVTVFRGRKRQNFKVEILGTTRSMTPGSSIVLARLESPHLEKSGLIAGMSGSPVYIYPEEGEPAQLLGAVAYGFAFARAAIAGITPAEDMKQLLKSGGNTGSGKTKKTQRTKMFRKNVRILKRAARDIGEDESDRRSIRRRLLGERLKLFGLNTADSAPDVPVDVELSDEGRSDGKASMSYLPVPMAVGDFGDKYYDRFASLVRMGGYLPVQSMAAKGGKAAAGKTRIAAGMPIGGVYVTGDLQLAGIGTITFVDGKKLVGFGHPMGNTGMSKLPLATGRVQAVIPSYMRSFRLASIDRVVGTLVQDRGVGIVGKLGEKAPMFPVTVRVTGDHETTYNYKVAGYWRVAPMASFYAAMAGALHWEGQGTGETIVAESTIKLEGVEDPIVLENTYAGYQSVAPIHDMILRPLSFLMPNPFRDVTVEKLDVHLQIEPQVESARVEGISLQESRVKPGEMIRIRVQLKKYQGKTAWKEIKLRVPTNAQPGSSVNLIVCGAQTYRMLRAQLDPGFFAPDDFHGLLENVRWSPSNTRIYARAGFIRRGLRYQGTAMPNLPGSTRVLMESGTAYGRTEALMKDQTTSVQSPWVIQGLVRARLNIVREK